ncbi:MAG: YhjD/YihY/BrkB family envelope integrity protein [Cyanobacteriota bacterium]|nr:YhjD/YihY/BrkB family envelope integrity protein [Cyanobacteriota bacterium]
MGLRLARRLRIFWCAYKLWLRFDCVDLSASFAFHTLQSFFPALLIALALASRFLGQDDVLLERVRFLLAEVVPSEARPLFADALSRFLRQGFGAGLIGLVLLVLNANNIYLTLQRGADRLWWDRPSGLETLSWPRIVRRFVLLRVKSLFILLLVGPLMLADQLIGNIRVLGSTMLRDKLSEFLPPYYGWLGTFSAGADLMLSNLLAFISVIILLWLLPSRRVPFRPLIPGALLISSLSTCLTLILGRLLFLMGLRFQAYGVVGGILLLMLWLWLLGVILYFGQCLSVAIARSTRGGPSALFLPFGSLPEESG